MITNNSVIYIISKNRWRWRNCYEQSMSKFPSNDKFSGIYFQQPKLSFC